MIVSELLKKLLRMRQDAEIAIAIRRKEERVIGEPVHIDEWDEGVLFICDEIK
jgi:hypothetical protein